MDNLDLVGYSDVDFAGYVDSREMTLHPMIILPKAFWMIPLNDNFILKPCAFLWVANFWCHTTGFANLDTLTTFHHWGLCLTIIDGSFTRGGSIIAC